MTGDSVRVPTIRESLRLRPSSEFRTSCRIHCCDGTYRGSEFGRLVAAPLFGRLLAAPGSQLGEATAQELCGDGAETEMVQEQERCRKKVEGVQNFKKSGCLRPPQAAASRTTLLGMPQAIDPWYGTPKLKIPPSDATSQ